MHPESFFHVAIKADDLDAGKSFYRTHFDAAVVERGSAADGEGATAVNRSSRQLSS
jgi:catechol 2,3-dioxygenase-like lactoylglutathione lyase family enzyme